MLGTLSPQSYRAAVFSGAEEKNVGPKLEGKRKNLSGKKNTVCSRGVRVARSEKKRQKFLLLRHPEWVGNGGLRPGSGQRHILKTCNFDSKMVLV